MQTKANRWAAALCAGTLVLSGCMAMPGAGSTFTQSAPALPPVPTDAPTPPAQSAGPQPDAVEQLLRSMTLHEQICQLFFVRPDALDPTQTPEQVQDADAPGVCAVDDAMRETMRATPVGGVVLFGKNLRDEEALAALVRDLQDAAPTPLLLAVDEEGGSVARLANHKGFALPQFADAAVLAQQGGEDAVQHAAQIIGGYLYERGILLNFAPVADVDTNPQNPVIGKRAYASDADAASRMVAAAVQGYRQSGVLCTLKHFPGHGDTAQDSHTGAATTARSYAEMQQCELLPFAAGMAAGAQLVMAAHIATPNAGTGDTPASLSSTWLTDRLRGEMGFEGVIATDSLAMQAITDRWSSGEAAVLALQAGADLLLMPQDLPAAVQGVEQAVQNGTLTPQRIEQSARRILQLKQQCGLLEQAGIPAP